MTKTKRERFIDVAGKRTNRIINDFRLLGNCSATNNYEYSESDIRKMFSAIENSLKETKVKFVKTDSKNKFSF